MPVGAAPRQLRVELYPAGRGYIALKAKAKAQRACMWRSVHVAQRAGATRPAQPQPPLYNRYGKQCWPVFGFRNLYIR